MPESMQLPPKTGIPQFQVGAGIMRPEKKEEKKAKKQGFTEYRVRYSGIDCQIQGCGGRIAFRDFVSGRGHLCLYHIVVNWPALCTWDTYYKSANMQYQASLKLWMVPVQLMFQFLSSRLQCTTPRVRVHVRRMWQVSKVLVIIWSLLRVVLRLLKYSYTTRTTRTLSRGLTLDKIKNTGHSVDRPD